MEYAARQRNASCMCTSHMQTIGRMAMSAKYRQQTEHIYRLTWHTRNLFGFITHKSCCRKKTIKKNMGRGDNREERPQQGTVLSFLVTYMHRAPLSWEIQEHYHERSWVKKADLKIETNCRKDSPCAFEYESSSTRDRTPPSSDTRPAQVTAQQNAHK